jgi:hypothetical protein
VARFDHQMPAASAAHLLSDPGRRYRVLDRMRQARRAAGCTQKGLAAELGIPLWKLSRYELGLAPVPPRLLLKMVDCLDLPATGEQLAARMH